MRCRHCGASLHQQICFLPDMPLTDEFVPINCEPAEFICDITIYQCGSCGLVQNPVDFDYEGYYKTYEYSSGHSEFTRSFMRSYAQSVCDTFRHVHGREAKTVLEIGSGDGEQLRIFQQMGVSEVLGVEPSDALIYESERMGVPAYKGLFSLDMIKRLPRQQFDICLSSYTLDHVRNPADYLRAAHELLVPGGVLAFEVHDLSQIAERGEWCLFEHEHTIYMDEEMARQVAIRYGFEVLAINPLSGAQVRANSLILIARKAGCDMTQPDPRLVDYSALQVRIDNTAELIDSWIRELPARHQLVGYGAGGRGVMTLAALREATRFVTLFDSNHSSGLYLTPKTHIPISGLDRLGEFNEAWCLVFSFGYIAEVTATLEKAGYQRERIVSLRDFLT